MDVTEAREEAQKLENGIRMIVAFVRRPAEEKVTIIREALDAEIGNDPGALFPTIPGLPMPAGFVETISDPMLDILAKLLLKVLTGEEVETEE